MGGTKPSMAPSTARSQSMSSRLSSRSGRSDVTTSTQRRQNDLEELSRVKKDLEEALRQVKAEMKAAGATKSQMGGSTSRSNLVTARSDTSASTMTSAMGTDWEAWGRGKKKDQLNTRRQ